MCNQFYQHFQLDKLRMTLPSDKEELKLRIADIKNIEKSAYEQTIKFLDKFEKQMP